MSFKLLATAIPFEDESAGSILLRTSAHNGYHSPRKLLHSLAMLEDSDFLLKTESTISSEEMIKKACSLLGVDIPKDHVAIPRKVQNSPDHYLFCGVSVHRLLIRKKSQYCPECIEEKGYFLRVWDHKLINACSKHEVKLVNTCHVCNISISWDRKHLLECDCGASLITAPTEKMECKGTKLLIDIFNTGNAEAYINYLDFRKALSEYMGEEDLEHLEDLLEMGIESPIKLGKALANEIISSNEINFHPRLTFANFRSSENPDVRKAAEIAAEIITKHENFYALAHDYDVADLLHYDAAAAAFGITRKQVKNLLQNSLLEGLQPKPKSNYQITKRSIHDLLMKLSDLQIHKSRNTVTIAQLIEDSRHGLSLTQIIEKVLSGDIKLSEFEWSKPLLTARVIAPTLPPKMRSYQRELVSIEDFSNFTGFHSNIIRDLIKANRDIDHFNAGITKGPRKYLLPSKARKLFLLLKESIQKKSNLRRINKLSIEDIPTVNVDVYYPVDSTPTRLAA